MKTSWNLKGKKAYVTGGSKGIGKATVIEFLQLGADVLFSARNEDEIQNVEKELKAEFPNSPSVRSVSLRTYKCILSVTLCILQT